MELAGACLWSQQDADRTAAHECNRMGFALLYSQRWAVCDVRAALGYPDSNADFVSLIYNKMKKRSQNSWLRNWTGFLLLALAAVLAFYKFLRVGHQVEVIKSNLPGPSLTKPKLALLFLARNRMPLDFLWERFLEDSKEHEFSIYIHARPGFVYSPETTKCKFFYYRQLPNSIRVEWGEASMVEAERLLLTKALEDPANERFLMLSESCIPLYRFSYIYEYIMSSSKSFVDSFRDTKENRYNPKMNPTIPRGNWRKGSQWFVLTRKHAEVVAADETILPVFRSHCKRGALPEFWREYKVNGYKGSEKNCVPDEHYIQTVLAMKGLDAELERRSLTYSLWKFTRRRRERQGWHPITFSAVTLNTIKDIQAIDNIKYDTEWRTEWCSVNGDPRPCFLFARKFTKASALRLVNMTLDSSSDIYLYHDIHQHSLGSI